MHVADYGGRTVADEPLERLDGGLEYPPYCEAGGVEGPAYKGYSEHSPPEEGIGTEGDVWPGHDGLVQAGGQRQQHLQGPAKKKVGYEAAMSFEENADSHEKNQNGDKSVQNEYGHGIL